MSKAFVLAVTLCAVWHAWCPAPGQAQEEAAAVPAAASAEANEAAQLHFKRGVELYSEGNYDAALAEFERAYQSLPSHKILYNLAQVQMERHEYVAATQLYRKYLEANDTDITPERRKAVELELSKAQQRLAELTVELNVDGAQLFINDQPVGVSPLREPVLVNVGVCRIRAEKSGYKTQVSTLKVAGAEQTHVKLELTVAAATPEARTRLEMQTVTEPNMVPMWISAGALVLLGGASATFAILSSGASTDLDAELERFPGDPNAIDGARGRLKTYSALTDGFGAGALVAAASTVYFLLNPPTQTERRPVSAQAQVTAGPHGLAIVGSF